LPVFIFFNNIHTYSSMVKSQYSIISNSLEQTFSFAQEISKNINSKSNVIFLIGDLGSGKTTFTKGFARGLGFSDQILSPTFPILNEYEHKNLCLYHFDLYRLKNINEFYEIGGLDYLSRENSISLIEWPEIISSIKIENKISIYFEYISENERKIWLKK